MGNLPEFGQLNAQDWNRLQDAASRFEQAWQEGPPPDLATFLPAADDRLRPLLLRELVKTDLEMRVRRTADVVRIEQYCERFPEIGAPSTLPATLIYEEYRVRQRYGDRPDLESFRERFPVQFAELQRLVEEPGTLRSIAADPTPNYPTLTNPNAEVPPPTPQVVIKPVEDNGLIAGAPGYRKIAYLGGGMFSDVWRGEAPGGCPVAIKIIRRPVDHEEVQGELRALELIKTLGHPFLAKIDAFWIVDGRMHVAMELAEKTLRQRLKECKAAGLPALPVDELLTYARDVAEVLDYLHSENIIHRDIKPENILLLKGHAKVADLGLARELEDKIQMSATSVGTPRYMAPEVWNRHVSKHSDQYSLAVTYAELRMGRSPFDSKDLAGAMLDAISGNPNLDGLAEPEKAVLRKAMARNPEDRYASCGEFGRALEAAARAASQSSAAPKAKPAHPSSGRPKFRDPRVLVPVAVIALVVPVALFFARGYLFHSSPSRPDLTTDDTSLVKTPVPGETQGTKTTPAVRNTNSSVPKPADKQTKPGPTVKQHEPPKPPAAPPLYERMVRASAQVQCSFALPDGNEETELGTAWVADYEHRLLITNHHVVENMAARGQAKVVDVATEAELLFPIWQDGHPLAEKKDYAEALRQGKVKRIHARVINSDPARDLALLQADQLPEGVLALPLAAQSPNEGEWLHSIGNPSQSQALWVSTVGSVRRVYHRDDHYANGQEIHAYVIENQSPTNAGDSGGAVVNDRGELVGVTSSGAGSPDTHLVGWFIDVREVKALLAESAAWLSCRTAEERIKRASYYLKRHLYSLAIADCDKLLTSGHGDSSAYRIRGIARRRKLDLDGALDDLNAAIAGGAADTVAYRERGTALVLKKRARDALADLDRAVQLDGKDARAHVERGQARKLLKDWQGAVDDFTAAEQAGYKPLLDIYVDRAEANYELRNYPAVLTDSQNTLSLPELTNEQKARAFSRGGDACAQLGQKKKALKYYNQAIELFPKDARAYNGRGLLHWDNKEYREAIGDYTTAINLQTDLPHTVTAFFYYNRGLAHRALGPKDQTEYQSALDDFAKAIQLDDKEAAFYHARALTYYHLKQYRKAIPDHDAALKLDDHNDRFFNARGLTFTALEQYVQAVDDYSNALKIRRDPVYYYNRGQAYEGLNDPKKAAADYRAALQLKADYQRAKDALKELSSGSEKTAG